MCFFSFFTFSKKLFQWRPWIYVKTTILAVLTLQNRTTTAGQINWAFKWIQRKMCWTRCCIPNSAWKTLCAHNSLSFGLKVQLEISVKLVSVVLAMKFSVRFVNFYFKTYDLRVHYAVLCSSVEIGTCFYAALDAVFSFNTEILCRSVM